MRGILPARTCVATANYGQDVHNENKSIVARTRRGEYRLLERLSSLQARRLVALYFTLFFYKERITHARMKMSLTCSLLSRSGSGRFYSAIQDLTRRSMVRVVHGNAHE